MPGGRFAFGIIPPVMVLLLFPLQGAEPNPSAADEQLLKAAKIGTDGPALLDFFRKRTDQAAAVIQNWINQGLMDPVDPMLFLFHLWAVTQFYADHATQVAFFRNVVESDEKDRRYLIDEVTEFLLKGAGVR